MAPAIKQGRYVAGAGCGMGRCSCLDGCKGCFTFLGAIGFETGATSSELAEALFVGGVEMGLQGDEGLLCSGVFAPIFNSIEEDSRVFKIEKCGSDGHLFRDGVMVGGEEAALSGLFPEVFKWLVAGPCAVEVIEISIKIIGGDGAVSGVKVIE
jgi:hypothetical protein